MKTLVDKFFSLRCAGDVLESVQPIKDDFTRRLSESMALIEEIRTLCLKNNGAVKVIEICSGVPLTGVIAAHLLPVESVSAYCWRGERVNGLDGVNHLKVHYGDYDAIISHVWTEARRGKTVVVAASAPEWIARDIMLSAHTLGVPAAVIPARCKVKLRGSAALAAKVFGNYGGFLYDLANIGAGCFRQAKALTGPNNGIVTRGL